MNIHQPRFRWLPVYLVLMTCQLEGLMAVEYGTPLGDRRPARASLRNPAWVLDAWMALQIRLMSSTPASFNGPFIRIYAYTGISAYASIPPAAAGDAYAFALDRLQDFPVLPLPEKDKTYHWPASLNSAMAFMNRVMFPMTSASNRGLIQLLEDSIRMACAMEAGEAPVDNAARYGLMVSRKIYEWAEKDGYKQGSGPYVPSATRGTWKPTAPGYAPAVTPYWGRVRTIVHGSIEQSEPPPPPLYSEEPGSQFHTMVMEVYKRSKSLTPEEKNIAHYWKDVSPGVTATGHWLNILRRVIEQDAVSLEKAVLAYALTGIALNDTWISSWKARYKYNIQRPITYIRDVIGDTAWMPEIATPPHPEYPGGHAALSASVAEVLTAMFGKNYVLTDRTYEFLGMGVRRYPSFHAIAEEAAISKVYGGIHYRLSVQAGLQQGIKVSRKVLEILSEKERSRTGSIRSEAISN